MELLLLRYTHPVKEIRGNGRDGSVDAVFNHGEKIVESESWWITFQFRFVITGNNIARASCSVDFMLVFQENSKRFAN